MSNLVRRSWSNRGGSDPSTWELPVNQASKWLVGKSGSFRIQSEGGSVALTNNDSKTWLLSVFIGDGGSVTVGGASGANTIQISRAGNTLTIRVQANSGSAVTHTATTEMPPERWANVYLRCVASGFLNSQVTVTRLIDFIGNPVTMINSSGGSFVTNNKTLVCNSLSGWAWFGSTTGGFWGFGGTSSVPITDVKYREAVINNATWDLDVNTSLHTYTRPPGLRYARAWMIQAGGGNGGDGASGSTGNCSDGGSGSPGGPGGNDGSPGSPGSSGGSGGKKYEPVGQHQVCEPDSQGGQYCYWVTDYDWVCYDGAGGSGGSGGAGGRGVVVMLSIMQESFQIQCGMAGTRGSTGRRGSDGGHTTAMGVSTASGLPYSTGRSVPTIKFGITEFTHGLGAAETQGGVVFYYQW